MTMLNKTDTLVLVSFPSNHVLTYAYLCDFDVKEGDYVVTKREGDLHKPEIAKVVTVVTDYSKIKEQVAKRDTIFCRFFSKNS